MIRIGLWGTFDVENYGDALFPRLAARELASRIPDAAVKPFGLVGAGSPSRFDGWAGIEALGEPTPERLADLADDLDVVVVGGGEIVHVRDEVWAEYYPITPEDAAAIAPSRFFIDGLGEELEEECPVVWHAVGLPFDIEPSDAPRFRRALERRPHVSVRDRASMERLRAAGVDREIALVPDPAILLPRLFPEAMLARRLQALRSDGSFPSTDRVLTVQGSRAHLPYLAELASAVREVCGRTRAVPLLLETGPCHGDGEFAAALARQMPDARRFGPAGLVDVTAAIAGSAGFVGVSMHGSIAALAYGRPQVILGMNGETKLAGLADAIGDSDVLVRSATEVPEAFRSAEESSPRDHVVAELQERADAQFDTLAEIARRTEGGAGGRRLAAAADRDALRIGYRERGKRLVAQRWRFADRLAETEDLLAAAHAEQDRLREEISRLRERGRELEAEVAGKSGELDRLMATRTFRYTAALRRMYGRLRKR
jgi:polysaccharide pyruvyl transferase WcaK-like protein